jgi:hypothetical protein
MKFAVEMASGGMIYTPSFMTIGSGIQLILRLFHQQSEALQYWYYCREGFMKYTVEMASGHDDPFRHSSNIKVITLTRTASVV